MLHKYKRMVFRLSQLIQEEEKTLTCDEVASNMWSGEGGRQQFLELINRWNRQGLIGVPASNLIYVYVALPEGS